MWRFFAEDEQFKIQLPSIRYRFAGNSNSSDNGGGGNLFAFDQLRKWQTSRIALNCNDNGGKSVQLRNNIQKLLQMNTVLVLLCFCCYFNALNCDFVFDDISAIKENKDIRPETNIGQIFRNDFWGLPMNNVRSGLFFPLLIITFIWF